MVSSISAPGKAKTGKPAKPRPVPPSLTDAAIAEYDHLLVSGADQSEIAAAADRLSDLLRQQAAYQAPRQARRAEQAAKRAAKAAERAADPLAYRRPDQDLIDAHRWAKEHLSPLRWAIGHPSHGPTNATILARMRGAKAGDSATAIAPRQLQAARNAGEKIYCHSGQEKGILTIDIDAHEVWQSLDDACAVRDLILREWLRITGSPLRGADYESSGRGRHFSVGVDFAGRAPEEVVAIYRRFQGAIARMLYAQGHISMFQSVEIKGAPAVIEADLSGMRAGSFTQLPVRRDHATALQWLIYSRDTPISQIEYVAAQLESLYPPTPAQRPITPSPAPIPTAQRTPDRNGQYPPPGWAAATATAATQPIPAAPVQPITSSSSSSLGPGSPPFGGRPPGPASPTPTPIGAGASSLWGSSPPPATTPQQTDWEQNSFVRQRDALLRYARQLRRVPTVGEALEHIRRESLYTGDWLDGWSGRESRVSGILEFISRSFDKSKAQGSDSNDQRIESEWERQLRRARSEAPYGRYLGGVLISPEELAAVRCGVAHRLIISPNPDQSAPRNSFESLWTKFHAQGKVRTRFDKRKWKLIREHLESVGEVEVEHEWGPREAMKWRLLPGFHYARQGMSYRPKPQLTADQRLRRDSYSQRVTVEFFRRDSGEADLERENRHNLMGNGNSSNSLNPPENSRTTQDRAPPLRI